jgi:hypothetical protein
LDQQGCPLIEKALVLGLTTGSHHDQQVGKFCLNGLNFLNLYDLLSQGYWRDTAKHHGISPAQP